MIVTRRRRKPFPWKRLILPVIAIALVITALTWAPSREVITSGPLAPAWKASSTSFERVAAPFHFAAQNELLTQRNQQIASLQQQVTDLKAQDDAKAKKIASLNAQIGQLQAQSATHAAKPAAGSSPAPASAATANPFGGTSAASASSANDLASAATPDMRRTAAYWANMEPENAAKLVQKLPVPYVARVLALMSPDAVGAILDAVPASFAAQLTQEHPELKR